MLAGKIDLKRIVCLITVLLSIFNLTSQVRGTDEIAYSTYYPSNFNILTGVYLSGSLPTSVQSIDSDYFTAASAASYTTTSPYHPLTSNLLGNTSYITGTMGDLASDDGVYVVYRSYPSLATAQTLYAHEEATTIAGIPYYLQKPESADSTGINLTASMAILGRQLLGRFVYPMAGIGSVSASDWTNFYRAWRDTDQKISYDSVGSGNNGNGATTISWIHNVGNGTNRLMVIGVSITNATVSVQTVSVGAQLATFLRSDFNNGSVIGELWYLVNPGSGSKTVTITLSATARAAGGSVSYTGVSSTTPIDAQQGLPYGGGITPSISFNTTSENDWIFSNLAISGTATVVTHDSGQVHRYYQVGTGSPGSRAGDDGDDKPTTNPGLYTMSWNMSSNAYVVVQAVALRPAYSAGHVDVDILIRKSDGTIRTTIATNVADSMNLTSNLTTLSGTYSWAAYSTVDQTDYLEIDYYIDVTTAASGIAAYLSVDDSSVPLADETRTANIMLPGEYTAEAEFSGTSDTYSWTQLLWNIDSSWTTGGVTVTMQIYNYTRGAYSTIGDGFINYTSNIIPSSDETKTQTILINPQHFRDAAGAWKLKVKGTKTTTIQFDLKVDSITLESTYWNENTISTEFLFSSMTTNTPIQLNFTIVSQYNTTGVNVKIQVWNYSASAYATSGEAYLEYTSYGLNETKTLSVNSNPQSFTSNGNAKMKITCTSSITMPYEQQANQIRLIYGYTISTNSPPVLNPIGPKSVDRLETLSFTATASDPDIPAQTLTFSLGPNTPTGASITATGFFTWTPAENQALGNYTIQVIVSDGALTDYEDVLITVYEARIHDVAVISVTSSTTSVVSGQIVNIKVIVKNQGTLTETFNVTLFCNETTVETKAVSDLASANQTTVEFNWNTTGIPNGIYKMHAVASTVTGETVTNNNFREGDMIRVNSPVSFQPFDWGKAILYASPVIFVPTVLILILIMKSKRKRKTAPPIEDLFSLQFGMSHQQIAGKKMLLEIDPESDYQKALSSFVSEAKNSNEYLIIITGNNSTLHSYFSGATDVKFLLLSSEMSSSHKMNEAVLPVSDLSILLDAITGVQNGLNQQQTINILFDNLTSLLLTCGFEETYKFTKSLLKAIEPTKTTALFLFSPTAHESSVSSSIRDLFQDHLAYGKSGPEIGLLA